MPIYQPGSNNTRVWNPDTREWVPVGEYEDPEERRRREVEAAIRNLLGRDPTPEEINRVRNQVDIYAPGAEDPARLLFTAANYLPRKTLIDEILQDPAKREEFRHYLLTNADYLMGPGGAGAEGMDYSKLRSELERVPVSFLGPDVSVSREQIDTPEERAAFLQAHAADTPLDRALLEAALNYGGLQIEPTPFGTYSRPGGAHGAVEWYRPTNGPGELEQQLLEKYRAGGTPSLQELSMLAQERQGAYRLRAKHPTLDLAMRAALAVPFTVAGGYLGGAALGPVIGSLGVSPAVASGIGSGAGAGFAGSAISSRGDPNAILAGTAAGAVTGGIGASLPGGGGLAGDIGRGAVTSGAGNLAAQGVRGQGIDWRKFVAAMGSGGASGALGGLNIGGRGSGLDSLTDWLTRSGTSLGTTLMTAAGRDPMAGANAQLEQGALAREQAQQAAMQQAQEEWKRRYAAASAEQQRAMQEAMRAAQQQWEAQRGQYLARLQAFLAEREKQIREALRLMGAGEPGIAALLAERRHEIEQAQAAQAKQEAALVESRRFFPSQLLETSPGVAPFATSEVLVPHSPPAARFGTEGLPATFSSYAPANQPMEFSAEGFLPSGALAAQEAPAAVSPMASPRRPRYFPTLLGGLSRSPYLRYA